MELFFDVAYAAAIFAVFFVAGWVPGLLVGVLIPVRDRRVLLVPAYVLAVSGWIWLGWVGGLYGISRLGLVLFSAVGAVAFVRGWALAQQGGLVNARAGRRVSPAVRRRGARPSL